MNLPKSPSTFLADGLGRFAIGYRWTLTRNECAAVVRKSQDIGFGDVRVFKFYDPPEEEGERLEFRLTYQGSLPPEKWSYSEPFARAKDKHKLRKYFHLQLRELWKQHPDLRRQAETRFTVQEGGFAKRIAPVVPGEPGKTWVEHIADNHVRCNGNRFVPLISEAGGFTCALNILFLRRDNPGSLLDNAGDVDSRLKVLLDGLRMPTEVKELGGYVVEEDENPFYCLLEDDKLITSISITTDRLITALQQDENINDVVLVVHVTMVNPSAIFSGNRLV